LLAVVPGLACLYLVVLWRSLAAVGDPATGLATLVAFWTTWRPVAMMTFDLLAFGASALVLGAFDAPERFPDLWVAGVAGLWGLGALVAVLLSAPTPRRRLLGLLAAAVAMYGAIAVGRATLYSGRFPLLQAASVARYHYAELVPLTLVLCMILQAVVSRSTRRPRV